MLIFPNNCQFGSEFWIRPNEADALLVNTHPKCSPGTRMQPLAQTDHRHYACEKHSQNLPKHRFGIMPRVALSEA